MRYEQSVKSPQEHDQRSDISRVIPVFQIEKIKRDDVMHEKPLEPCTREETRA